MWAGPIKIYGGSTNSLPQKPFKMDKRWSQLMDCVPVLDLATNDVATNETHRTNTYRTSEEQAATKTQTKYKYYVTPKDQVTIELSIHSDIVHMKFD